MTESKSQTTIRLTPAEALKMVEAIMMPRTPSDRAKAAAEFARMVFRSENKAPLPHIG